MKSLKIWCCIVMLLAAAMVVSGQDKPELTETQVAGLASIKHKVNGVHELANSGVITPNQADQANNQFLKEAQNIAGRPMSMGELATIMDPKGSSEPGYVSLLAARVVGWFDAGTSIITAGVLLLVVSLVFAFWQGIKDLLRIFQDIPAEVYEVLGYIVSLTLLFSGKWFSVDYGYYFGLAGSLLLACCVGFTFFYHFAKEDKKPSLFFGILTIIFAATAIFYSSVLIAVFASIAFMSMLGFVALVIPMGYAIGFQDDTALVRATTVSFVMLTLVVLIRLFNIQLTVVELFTPGMLFMGSFVGYLGLLIVSSKWYEWEDENRYRVQQVITTILGAAAIIVGSVLSIPILMKVGGTFFALFLIEKLLEFISILKIRSVYGYCAVGVVVSAILIFSGFMIIENKETLGSYLLFL